MLGVKYTYPHIDFAESILGSIPEDTGWRGTIGVVGQFRRGPKQYKINDRQTFARLYGEDNSPGAKAVRMMLSLGATDIEISRAVTEALPSTSNIAFNNLVPGVDARIGFEGQVQQFAGGTPVYTTGLKLTANFIGDTLPSLTSVGDLTVKPLSKLNSDLNFDGRGNFIFTVENRVANTVQLVLNQALGAKSRSFTNISAVTFVEGTTGTLAALNATLTPLTTPLVASDRIIYSGGVNISVDSLGVYTVNVGGSVLAGEQALEIKTLVVNNALTRLEVGSKIYFNLAEIATVVKAQFPTNAIVTLDVITANLTPIPVTSVLESQAVIANATIEIANGAANKYKFIKVAKAGYEAFISNLQPGRVLYSKNSAVTFSGGYLTIVGKPIADPIDNDIYNVLVQGVVTGSAAALTVLDVALYESPQNAYVLSSTFDSTVTSKTYASAQRWRNQFEEEDRGVLVDTYHIIKENYQPNALKVDFLFVEVDGTVRDVDSGLLFDTPPLNNSGIVAYLPGSSYQVPVIRTSVASGELAGEAKYERGASAGYILQQLEAKMLQSNLMQLLIEPPILNNNLNPVSLSLLSKLTGAGSNRLYYNLERSTSGEDPVLGLYANDLLLNSTNPVLSQANWGTPTAPTYTYFVNGTEGSQAAFIDYYSVDSDLLVRVVALSEGAYGNKIKVSLTPGSNGQFILTAVDQDSASYQAAATVETLTLSTRDINLSTGQFNATSNSSLIRAFYVPALTRQGELTELELNKVPFRIAPAFGAVIPTLSTQSGNGGISKYAPAYQGSSYLQNLSLAEGRDAQLDSEVERGLVGGTAMRKALQRLEDKDVAILYLAGVVMGDARYASVVEEALGQVKRATTTNGKRRLVLQAPANLNVDQAALFGAQLNDGGVSLIAGHCSVLGISNTDTEHSAAFYAATLSLSPPHLSPAYLGNGVNLSLIRSVDTSSSPQYLDALTRAGVDALYFDSGLGAFKFLNGRTTSTIAEKRQVSLRRVQDEIIHALYVNLQPHRSAPNSNPLRALVASSCDAYLESLVKDGWIQSYSPTLCSLQNNPLATQAQNQLRIKLVYTPFFPADIFLVDVVQNVTQEIDLAIQ